ncbi:hypothetical protein [Streptomyces noursei]|uniref:hypothetical protein n=1 Tax=Streptomyces noursei TaxID=1971 RepID=UPI001E5E4F89|nr:hypothetical protein [Streptomyces noursei]MCZ1013931.1 hypothetical protein [Streptomyces noursei]
MLTSCVPDVLDVAEANERIRVFMAARAGRSLWPEEQAEYERLLDAWAAAAGHRRSTTT